MAREAGHYEDGDLWHRKKDNHPQVKLIGLFIILIFLDSDNCKKKDKLI